MIDRPEDPDQHQRTALFSTDLDQRLTSALEAAPSPAIPADFSRRVLSRLPRQAATSPFAQVTSTPIFGRRIFFAALILLLAGMFAIALHGSSSLVLQAIDWFLAAEFVILTLWIALRPRFLL